MRSTATLQVYSTACAKTFTVNATLQNATLQQTSVKQAPRRITQTAPDDVRPVHPAALVETVIT
jgi:hypothetical protein